MDYMKNFYEENNNGMSKDEKKVRDTMDWMIDTRETLIDQLIEENIDVMDSLYDADKVEGFWEQLKNDCYSVCRDIMTRKMYYMEPKADKMIEILNILNDGEQEYYEKLSSEWRNRCKDEEEEEVMKQAWYDLLYKRMEYRLIKMVEANR